LRFVIYTDDHAPAHVHAIGPDGEAKKALGAAGAPPALVWIAGRLRNAEVRFALAEAAREQPRMLAAWRRIHGGGGL
jgi:hypothetical protein